MNGFVCDFFINFIQAPLPVRGGWAWCDGDLMIYLTNKQCFIQTPCKADNLCCARALIRAKAGIDNHPQRGSIRNGCNIQTHLAQQLNQEAEIPEGKLCSKEEWDKFQNILGPEYQLLIYSQEYFNTSIHRKLQFAEKTDLSLPCCQSFFCHHLDASLLRESLLLQTLQSWLLQQRNPHLSRQLQVVLKCNKMWV